MLKLFIDISENYFEFVDEGEDCMCVSIFFDYVFEINMYVFCDVNVENLFIVMDKVFNEIKVQGVDELVEVFKLWVDDSDGDYEVEWYWVVVSKEVLSFVVSLRSEQNV